MIQILKQLYQIFTPTQRRMALRLQLLSVLMAVVDVVAIASIGPFIALAVDLHVLDSHYLTNKIATLLGYESPANLLFLVGFTVLALLAFSAAISIYTTYKLSMFSHAVGSNLSSRLYQYYLSKNWLFYVRASTPQLSKQATVDAAKVTQGLINPLMQMNARLVLVFAIIMLLFFYQPLFSLLMLGIFPAFYVAIYYFVRRRITDYEQRIASANLNRFTLLRDGFGGIKELLLTGRQQEFINQFKQQNIVLSEAQAKTQVLGVVPRFIIEFIAFGGMIALLLLSLKFYDAKLVDILPLLSIYTLAGFKLLPAFQIIYTSYIQIKSSIPSFHAIHSDLVRAFEESLESKSLIACPEHSIVQGSDIKLQNVSFTYPGKVAPALVDVSLHIKPNTTIALVGASGAGKSTTVDVILGLIEPQIGNVIVDGSLLSVANKAPWQQRIGYVPQSIFLTSASIAQNVAFGIAAENIDFDKVRRAIKLANLEDFIATLPDGLHSTIGENGMQLSGGQRQRLGIARALYNQPSVLVFDEATSALDTITERAVMDALADLSGKITIIIIAHRLNTVKDCDSIYLMKDGRVVDQGSFAYLLENNMEFKKMVGVN